MGQNIGESLEVPADDRFKALQEGLSQLTDDDLARLQQHIATDGALVLDEVHFYYDDRTGKGMWCPLAVELDVPRIAAAEAIDLSALTERCAAQMIRSVGRNAVSGFTLNPISGVSGEFFTGNRRRDIAVVVGSMTTKS